MRTDRFIKIAHRGASGSCPENTRVAFEKALESGVDMIEVDCQLSKDGHVVVFHDEGLSRIAGVKGLVRGKSLKQLKKLDVGIRFKKSFKGERILALEEVLEIVAGHADLNVDIKPAPRGPLGIELKILFILSHYGYLERTVLSSFDYRSLRRVRELAPEARVGLLYRDGMRENPFEVAGEIGAFSLHIEKDIAAPAILERARKSGLKTFVWTVNEVAEMERFLSLGAHGLISDFPERFWKIKPRRA